ncbi:MAG: sugar ABC transporter permease [Clostridia bacterium]|nr:sugar ABC transporter permease [Clostridia bacterium]
MEKKKHSKLKTSPLVNPYVAILATLPALVSIFVLSMLPSIVNLAISFTDYHGVGQPFEFVGFDNFIRAFKVGDASVSIWDSLLNTVVFSISVVIVQQALSLGMALVVARKFKGRSFFRALFFMPTILGVSVVGFTWQLVFDPVSGPIAVILTKLGKSSALLGEEVLSMFLVVLVAIWSNFGYAMVVYIAGLQNISEDIREAAEIDGARGGKMFWYITLPLLKNTLVINFWISISGTLAMFDIIFVLTNGTANTTTLALYIFQLATNSASNQGQAAALNIYFSLFVMLVMLVFNATVRRKEAEE